MIETMTMLGVPAMYWGFVLVALTAFLLGSIPTSFLIGTWFYGIDPREYGSGASGATNTARSLGAKAAIFTGVFDIFKGWSAVMIAKWFIVPQAMFDESAMLWAMGLAMIAVALGHAYSPWLGFRGGKSASVVGGATLAFNPIFALLCIAFMIVAAYLIRYMSVVTMAVAAFLPIGMALLPPSRGHIQLVSATAVSAVFVIWLHRENIKRLLAGEENKISFGSGKGDSA